MMLQEMLDKKLPYSVRLNKLVKSTYSVRNSSVQH